MNRQRAICLYEAVTQIREDWVEDALPRAKARRRPQLRALAAFAACVALVLLGAYALAHIPGSRFASGRSTGQSTHAPAPGSAYLDYMGPVMPLTAEGEHAALTLERRLELDLEDFVKDRTCRVTDAYTLSNTGSAPETVTLLYPFADALRSDPEAIRSLTVNGEPVVPELSVGPSIPEVRAEWTAYLAHLREGGLTLPDPGELLSRPVTVYELRDCWADPETPGQRPVLQLEFTLGREKSAALSWGFNGGAYDPGAGVYARSRTLPLAGEAGEGRSAYLIILGEDIREPVLRAYTNGTLSTLTDRAGGTLVRRETTLGKALALCAEDMWSWEADSAWWKRFTAEELAAAVAAVALEQGWWTLRSYISLRSDMLEDVFSLCLSYRRILLLRFTVTVPAGESLEIRVKSVKAGSHDYNSDWTAPGGFDAISAGAGSLPVSGETVTAVVPEGVVCSGSDLIPEEGKLRYFLDVKQKSLK